MRFDLSKIGLTIKTEEFRVNTVRLAQYAASIDDTNPRHLEGGFAPPVFAHCPVMQATVELLKSVTDAFAFHGEHDFHFHRPIEPGMHLFSTATLQGVIPSPAGVSIVIKTRTQGADGKPINDQYMTGFVAKASVPKAAGTPAPGHRVPDKVTAGKPFAELACPMALDQTRRYADASRDYSDYALVLEAARAKGFDGILAHGMLTLCYAGRTVIDKACGGDTARLKRLACRFSRPVYVVPNQAITTRLFHMDRREGREVVAFESFDAAGTAVLKHGIAEIAA